MATISAEINAAKEAGFSDQEIKDGLADEINSAKEAGFTEQEINQHYNFEDSNKNITQGFWGSIKKDLEETFEKRRESRKEIKKYVIGEEFDGDYITEQILGTSLYNLQYRAATKQGTPDAMRMPKPQDLTFTEDLLLNVGKLAYESPIYGLSALLGLPAGPIGAGFTGAAIPETTRLTLLKILENQDEGKPSDIMKILLEETLYEGSKEGVKFGTSMALPLLRVPGVGKLSKNYFTRTASQIVGYEGTGMLIDQEVPNLYDFGMSSSMFAIFNVFVPKQLATKKTKNIFVKTGEKPSDVAIKSAKDGTLKEDLVSLDNKIPRSLENKLEKPIEVKPDKIETIDFKDPILKKAGENFLLKKNKMSLDADTVSRVAKKSKRKFVIDYIDQKYPVYEMLKQAGVNTKTGIEKLNIYEATRLLEGSQGRAVHFLEYGTLDFKTLAEKGPSFLSIVQPYAKVKDPKKSIDALDLYLGNKQAIDLATRGIKTNVDIENAKKFVKKYKKNFEKTAEQTYRYQNDLVDYAADGGLISKEARDAYKKINRNYVPMRREQIKEGKSGIIKDMVNPFKKLKGSTLKIKSPIESIVKNTDFIIRATEKNKAMVDLIDFSQANKSAFPYIKKKKGNLKPVKVLRKDLEIIFDKEDIAKMSDNVVNDLTIFRQERVYPDAQSIAIRRNGKYEVWEVGEDLVNAFRSVDPVGMNIVQRFLSLPARTLRTGAIVTPDFAVPNFFKDTLNATFLSKIGWIPIVDSFKGMFSVIYKDPKRANEAYKRYLKSGGAFATLRSVDKNIFDKGVHEILNKGVLRNEYRGPLGPFRYLTDISEEMTRVGMSEKVYKAGIKKGLTEKQALERAGFESRNLLDYQKKGTIGATINRYSSFWNARAQGSTIIYEAFRDRPKKVMTMIGLTVVLPTLGFMAANYDFEKKEFNKDYLELPEYIKTNKWYFKIGDQGTFFPKGFEVGTFFSSIIEKTILAIHENDKQGLDEFLRDFTIQNIKAFNPVPTFFRPHIENLIDYSFFRDAPVLPPSAPKNMLNKYYSTEYTNEAIKRIAEGLAEIVGPDSYGANPIFLENMYDQYTGGIGRMIKQSIEALLIYGKLIDNPIKPTDPLTKIPAVRAFQAKDVYGYSASIARYYKRIDKYKKVFNSVKFIEKTDPNKYIEEVKKLSKDYNFDVEAVLDIEENMKDVSRDIRIIYNSKYKDDGSLFTNDEKRELIDRLYIVRIGLARDALKIMKALEEEDK